MWSGTSTKNFEFILSAGNPGNLHLWSSNFSDPKLHMQTNNATFQRSVEQKGQTNGTIEGWINGSGSTGGTKPNPPSNLKVK